MDDAIRIDLISDRPLYSPPEHVKFKRQQLQEGEASGGNELLYEQVEKGVAEVVAYLDIAAKNEKRNSVSTDEQEEVLIRNSQTEQVFKVKIPKIIFNR